jgi:hypothetical protein
MEGVTMNGHGRRRPRWWVLYVTLLAIAVIGTIAHAMVADAPRLVTITDVASAFGLLGAMAVWVRLNRVQLSDEPDAGRTSPRSAAHPGRMKGAHVHHDGVVRLEPGDRAVTPYEFR